MSLVAEDVKTLVDEMLKVVSTKNVISDPYQVDNKVIITITKVGLGFGTGKGESKGSGGNGMAGVGQGIGGAVGVSPVAVLVIDKSIPGPGGVEVKFLTASTGVARVIGEVATSIMQGMVEMRAKKSQMEQQSQPMMQQKPEEKQ
jgi:uncharacterized spore protein YtfJ